MCLAKFCELLIKKRNKMNVSSWCVIPVIAVFAIDIAAAQSTKGIFPVSRYKTQDYSNSSVPFSIESNYSLNNINLNAVRDFLKRYKNEGENVTWDVSDEGNFIARFTADSIDVITAYGKKGNWLYSVRRYTGHKLSDDLKSLLKKEFPGYSIV